MACHQQVAATGINQAAEHFQRGGFASAIGSEEAHHLAGLDRETEVAHGLDQAAAAPEKMAQGSAQARLLLGDPVGLAEALGANDRHRQAGGLVG